MNTKHTIVMLVAFTLFTITLHAQPPHGGNRAKMQEMMKHRLKDAAQLTDVEADSVAAIQRDFQMASRPIKTAQSLTLNDKKAKTNALQQTREARLKANLNAEKLTKVKEFYENMRKNMPHRGNGTKEGTMPPPPQQ